MAAKKRKKDTKSIIIQPKKLPAPVRYLLSIPAPLLALAVTALLVVVLFPFVPSVQSFDLPNEGEVARETIIAPFTFDIPKSPEELEKQRQAAMNEVLMVLDYEEDTELKVRRRFLKLKENLAVLQGSQTPDSLEEAVRGPLGREFSQKTLRALVRRPYLVDDALFEAQSALRKGIPAVLLVPDVSELSALQRQYNTSFDQHLIYDKAYVSVRRDSISHAVALDDLQVKQVVLEEIMSKLKSERGFDEEALNTVYELLFAYLKPNMTIDGEETARRKQAAAREVLQIKGKVIKDTEIMRKHQVVTGEMVEKLAALRQALQKRNEGSEKWKVFSVYAGKNILVLSLLVLAALYLWAERPQIIGNARHLWAICSILIVQIGIIRVGLLIVPRMVKSGVEFSSIVPEYAIPTIVGAILAAILFDFQVSLLITFFVSIFYGVVMGFNFSFFMYALLGGLIAGFVHRDIRYRWDFFRAMPPIAATYAAFVLLWHLISFDFGVMAIVQNVGLAFINVILSTFLAMMLTTAFENIFAISTNMTLVELSDMNHPILKRLSIEAAGTYNHSVLVGNLAESAAQGIGANALLCRVASYYHDIGKIEKSDYFVENLIGDKNVHKKLAPSMSALIICSHVKDGVELAKKYKLPKLIQDTILQHHGTSTVSFFYEKAREQDPHNQVQERDFRYPGPSPQTRETAVIMLADSVEAASRSLATSSPKLLRELVKKIIRDKFNAHQLDQCNLTLRDLDKIVDGFMPVLQGIFHSRIEYPSKTS